MNMKRFIPIALTIFGVILVPQLLQGQKRNFPGEPRNGMNQQEQILPKLTQDEEKAALEYLKEQNPEMALYLMNLRENRPMLYRRVLSRYAYEIRALHRIRESDPERYRRLLEEKKMEWESRMIVNRFRGAETEEEKQTIRMELKELLGRQFDLRQLNRIAEIQKLERRLEELKSQNEERMKNKEKIVDQRLNALLGDNEKFKW
jgi:hypothetical protein